MVAFYGLVFLFPLIDGMMVELLIPETLSAAERMETYTTAAKSFISGSIWSSYFLISERVKETFVRTNDQKNNSLVQQHDNEEE